MTGRMQAVSALTERSYGPLDTANNRETETGSPISTSHSLLGPN